MFLIFLEHSMDIQKLNIIDEYNLNTYQTWNDHNLDIYMNIN